MHSPKACCQDGTTGAAGFAESLTRETLGRLLGMLLSGKVPSLNEFRLYRGYIRIMENEMETAI